MIEFPIQVTPGVRVPFIGTSLALLGRRMAAGLAKSLAGRPFVHLELHGIDALDAGDDLGHLAAYQPDLRRRWSRKLEALSAAVGELRKAGYGFVTLAEAASRYPR